MGWYLRKSFSAGPFRLNLSRSGLGASFGVKGARIGMGPRGSYIHMGRGGLYYRESLNPKQRERSFQSPNVPDREVITTDQLQEIESADIQQIVDSSSETILKELNRVKNYFEIFPVLLLILAIAPVVAYFNTVSDWVYYAIFIPGIPLLFLAQHNDVTKGTAILRYEFEPQAQESFQNIVQAFNSLMSCARVWHIEAEGDQSDWKRNAGANKTVRRKTVNFSLSLPPRVQSNIKVPTLPAGKQTIYFFPDRVLIYAHNGVGVVSYSSLTIDTSTTRFMESDPVPNDAIVVDRTWQYVNKNGGPDRRFTNNREIPVTKYQEMHFKSGTGLNELFMFSKSDIGQSFISYISRL